MSKQTPMLMESPLTKRVFVVTSYKDKGDGIFEARQKYDVTEQFDALAEQRIGMCEIIHDQDGVPRCSNCQNVLYDEYKDGIKNYCDECGRRVER